MWKGYVVLREGGVVTICKNTLMEMLDCIAADYHIRASSVFLIDVEESEKECQR